MNQLIINSTATVVCKNIPADINRFEITEIFSKYGPLVGEGIYFGRKSNKEFYIKYQHLKDAIKAVENLKNGQNCPYDFNVSLSTYDETKYNALKGNKEAIYKLCKYYKEKDKKTRNEKYEKNLEQLFAQLNEQNIELLKNTKKEKTKKKDDSFILDLLAKPTEEEQCDEDIKLKEHLKNHINLNCLGSYNFDETNKYDNFLIPKFPN